MTETLIKKIDSISREFERRGYFIKDDLYELFEAREDIAEKLENIKYKKIEFFDIKEEDSVGFTLEDVQVNFFLEFGEDEEGPWYEAEAEVFFF
ncbi:MAG: hypothetical protein RR191_02760 [Cetobacterium sp.]|uniref:hypothetical protein n=1 Tax=unclassified Cetobacterium TaxID=2630983 RepID=UPI00163B680F|nr:hypothetical protein [Cetobacterium sp. 2A]MBC2856745.1 hypothetical protein [Cetobacterium sp. 2A]